MILASVVDLADSGSDLAGVGIALTGLLGVVLGGIIQVVLHRLQLMEEQTAKIRADCSKLAVTASHYGITAVQAAGLFDESTDEYRVRLRKNPWAKKLKLDEDLWNRLARQFEQGFRDVYDLSLSLSGCRDKKVSNQAMELHRVATNFHNDVAKIFLGKPVMRADEVDRRRDEMNTEASVLISMVSPRWYESYSRFRFAKTARSELMKLRSKREAEAAVIRESSATTTEAREA